MLYEDPELGFCILGHVYQGAKDSNPHDHGPSWAIYGQARGETVMTDYEPVARPGEGKPGKARRIKDYTLKPGMAYLYNEGDLHSPRRDGPTRLIRIEGKNMDEDPALSLRARRVIVGPGRPYARGRPVSSPGGAAHIRNTPLPVVWVSNRR